MAVGSGEDDVETSATEGQVEAVFRQDDRPANRFPWRADESAQQFDRAGRAMHQLKNGAMMALDLRNCRSLHPGRDGQLLPRARTRALAEGQGHQGAAQRFAELARCQGTTSSMSCVAVHRDDRERDRRSHPHG